MTQEKIDFYEKVFNHLEKIERLILSSEDKNTLLRRILEEIMQSVDAEAGSLFLYDEAENDLYFTVAIGEKADSLLNVRIPFGKGIVGSCVKERRTILVKDVQSDGRFFKNIDEKSKFKTRTLIAVPLYDKGELLGAIEVLNKSNNRRFDENDEKVLKILAQNAAIALKIFNLIDEKVQFERKAAVADAIAGISHYVKNILTGILSSKGIIDSFIEKKADGVIKRCWAILDKNINLISNLVQDMLTYSKIRKHTFVETNINVLIKDCVELYDMKFKNTGLKITAELDKSLPIVYVNPNSIKRCFLNIINNALDALSKKGSFLKIITKYENPHVKIFFIDNGPGIPKEIIHKIFNPFFSTKKGKGTGLGLAITKKIIEENGGTISVVSEEGKGTSFEISFPAKKC